MKFYINVLLFLPHCFGMVNQAGKKTLHIGGIFPMSADKGGWAGGQACLPAAQMALEDVNKNPTLLNGYQLVMTWNDSQCQPGLGGKVMFDLLYNEPKKLMLLAGCSLVTTLVAEAAPEWNMLVVAYGASSPALSNRDRFPTLFRTHPSATIHNPTRLFLFKKHNWGKIAILQTADEVFESTANDLEQTLQHNNIQVVARIFVSDPADAVQNLARSGARIIVGLFYESVARQILCHAYKHNLYGKKYVWFFIGWYSDTWFIPTQKDGEDGDYVNCTTAEMIKAADKHFTTEALMLNQDNKPVESGITSEEFLRRLRNKLVKPENVTDGFPEAPLAYDAIWAVAKALDCTIRDLNNSNLNIGNFNYENKEIMQRMLSCMNETEFYGVSGEVKFSARGERIMWTQIEQLQGGQYKVIGYYDALTGNYSELNEISFTENKVPKDDFSYRDDWKQVSTELYAALAVFACLGIITSFALILFNYKYSHRRFIYHSQPQVNNLLLAGCVVCFVSIFLIGLPNRSISVEYQTFSAMCHARVTLLMYGFSLAYGAMFSKVWLVQRSGSPDAKDQIMTNGIIGPKGQKLLRSITSLSQPKRANVDKLIEPWKFYTVIGVLTGIDTVIALVWIFSDPLLRKTKPFDEYVKIEDDVEIRYLPKMENCLSDHQYVWIGVIYSFKGLLLVFGLFLAYEIRNVKAKYVNDSRFVGMAIYNVAILSLITGSVSLIIVSQPDAAFSLLAITILLCGYISMGLIFGPKVAHVIQYGGSVQNKSITDNQLTPEEQERLKKLLVENEEIKRQITEKENKIAELKRRLEARKSVVAIEKQQQLIQNDHQLLLEDPKSKLPFGAEKTEIKPESKQLNNNENVKKHQIVAINENHSPNIDAEDSGYKSSNGRPGSQVEPLETDVLL